MSASTVVARGAAAAKALMLDACVIDRRTGTQTNRSNGATTDSYGPVLYEGPCKISQSGAGSEADVGEEPKVIIRRTLHLPLAESGSIREGDRVTVTASREPQLVGRTFTVRSEQNQTYATARRLDVSEVTS